MTSAHVPAICWRGSEKPDQVSKSGLFPELPHARGAFQSFELAPHPFVLTFLWLSQKDRENSSQVFLGTFCLETPALTFRVLLPRSGCVDTGLSWSGNALLTLGHTCVAVESESVLFAYSLPLPQMIGQSLNLQS